MPYQMTVGIAEERIREDKKEGSRISSEDDLVRRLRQLLPGWDIDVPTTARGETQDEVVGNWGRPGLIVQHYPALRYHSSDAGSDALAAIAPPEGMHESERLLMFAYQDIGVLTEMVVLHEVAHVLSFDFNAGHSERWLDIYLDLLDKAGLREAKNTISFMTGKMEMKFVEGSRRSALRMSMRKGAPFAGYDDFADCVSKNSDKDDPEAYCGAIKSKTEGARRSRTSQYRSIR